MSLGVVIKGSEGVVLAADSRVTLTAQAVNQPPLHVNFDNATKVLSFSEPNDYVGAVTYGQALIGMRTASSFVPEFELGLKQDAEAANEKQPRLSVHDFAGKLSEFFQKVWQETVSAPYHGPPMVFVAAGYDADAAHGRVFLFDLPEHPNPVPRNADENDFGMTWGGQTDVVTRIVHGYDPALPDLLARSLQIEKDGVVAALEAARENLEIQIPYNILPLQDCVDLAIFLISTTRAAQKLSVRVRGVGGQIEVATITRTKPLDFLQRKVLVGEGTAGGAKS